MNITYSMFATSLMITTLALPIAMTMVTLFAELITSGRKKVPVRYDRQQKK